VHHARRRASAFFDDSLALSSCRRRRDHQSAPGRRQDRPRQAFRVSFDVFSTALATCRSRQEARLQKAGFQEACRETFFFLSFVFACGSACPLFVASYSCCDRLFPCCRRLSVHSRASADVHHDQ
ncbi:unnamed protein product, partial [Pylaiella littoralis]